MTADQRSIIQGQGSASPPPGMSREEAERLVREADERLASKENP